MKKQINVVVGTKGVCVGKIGYPTSSFSSHGPKYQLEVSYNTIYGMIIAFIAIYNHV